MFLKTRCNPCKGFRSSHLGCSVKKMSLKVFQNSQENNYCGVSFQESCRLKRDSSTADFLQILQNFQEHLFYRMPPVAASEACKRIRHRPLQGNATDRMSSFTCSFHNSYFIVRISMAAFYILLFTCYEVILSVFEKVRAKSKTKAI